MAEAENAEGNQVCKIESIPGCFEMDTFTGNSSGDAWGTHRPGVCTSAERELET